jgi:PmbA protein
MIAAFYGQAPYHPCAAHGTLNMSKARFSYPLDDLRQLARDVLGHALQGGASACETEVSEGYGQSVSVRKGKVENIEYNRDKGVGVTVYLGQQKGFASTSDLSPQAVRDTVDKALSIARFTAADACAGLPDAALLAKDGGDLDLFHPWELSVDDAIDIARETEVAAFAVDPRITNSEGAGVSVQHSQFIAANSLGFMGGFPTSRHYVSCAVIAGRNDGMQRDDWYTSSRDARNLAPGKAVGRYAAERALSRLKARQVPTQSAPVLFEAPLAASLIGSFVGAASGGSLYRKSSFLLDSLGKQVFSDIVNLVERPHLKKQFGSTPFDDEGVATSDRDVVKNGVLQGYFLSSYSSRKLGMQTTGNAGGNHNLILKSGKHDLCGLLREMGTGLLVTELIGQGINMVTGDYSRGAFGYWVENGEIRYPVQEITIAGNLADMFKGIAAVGNDVLVRGSRQCGSILVDQMTIAGN